MVGLCCILVGYPCYPQWEVKNEGSQLQMLELKQDISKCLYRQSILPHDNCSSLYVFISTQVGVRMTILLTEEANRVKLGAKVIP